MGFNTGDSAHTMDDHSSTYNVGLVNLNNKSKIEIENEFIGLSFKEYIEIAVAILIIIYAARKLMRHFIKKKKKSSAKKKTELKELVEEATNAPTALAPMMTTQFSLPVKQSRFPRTRRRPWKTR